MHSASHVGTSLKVWRERLRHAYWIGGGSGSGKSTIARRIADRCGMRLYGTDAVMPDHVRRMPVEQAPYLGKFAAMDMDERWVTRSPREMLDTFHRRDALFTDQLTEKIRHLGLHGLGVIPRSLRKALHGESPPCSALRTRWVTTWTLNARSQRSPQPFLCYSALCTAMSGTRARPMRAYEPVASDAEEGRCVSQDLIRPGSEGPPRRHQMAISGSQIAQPNDECDANGMIGAPRR